ncbi:MAG: deoxyribonuclease V [Anaerolineae bacterium]
MLTPKIIHPWDCSPKEAIALQESLASHVSTKGSLANAETVAGIDVGIRGKRARAAVVVIALKDLATLEIARAERPVTFPYVPGLLTFREGPVVLDALAKLTTEPDVLLFDGQGRAHPRRMGLATHIGVLLDYPSVGCAKSRLCGTYEEPGQERGEYTLLYEDGEVVGAVLRTRTRVKPVFVSTGHRASLEAAIDLVLRCGSGVKLPEPTRRAHHAASFAGSG